MKNNSEIFEQIIEIGSMGRQKGLLSGFNGNISIRHEGICYITNSGSIKGKLTPNDIATVSIESKKTIKGKPSSELSMHLEIYSNCPNAIAIVHTHPINFIALELCSPNTNFLDLPLFEAKNMIKKLSYIEEIEPGTHELAHKVGIAHQNFEATWLSRHGLVCHADDIYKALALSEEFESLATIQLLARKYKV